MARLAGPTFLDMNILPRQAGSTRDCQKDNQGVREGCFQLLAGAEVSTFGDPLFFRVIQTGPFLNDAQNKNKTDSAVIFLTSYHQLIVCVVCLSQAELIRRYDTTLKKPRGD